MKYTFYLIFSIILLLSCAPKANTGLVKDTKYNMDEKFDPLSVPLDDKINIPEKNKKNIQVNQLPFENNQIQNTAIDTAALMEKKINGFRIQIFATQDREQAYLLKEEAHQIFRRNKINVYIDFDAPYYKIRIGDCVTRVDADKIRRIAKNKGYNKAWIIKSIIYEFPELLNNN